VGTAGQRPVADPLAAALRSHGVHARVAPEGEIMEKARYPRVWDPYITVYRPATEAKAAPEGVAATVTLESADDGRTVARTRAGADLGDGWRQPNTLATVVGAGYADVTPTGAAFYEPGVQLLVNRDGQTEVLTGQPTRVKTTEDVRRRWSRPWVRLRPYIGTYDLSPQLPEAYRVNTALILLGDSRQSALVAAVQAGELLPEVADDAYPGPGKALVSYVWSPFALDRDAIVIGASDVAGLEAGASRLLALAPN